MSMGHWSSIAGKRRLFMFPELEGEIGPRMRFHGREVITWSLNNYLGLANHPEVREADAKAAAAWGMAYPMGARMMSGQTKYHKELEEKLARFVGMEAALTFTTGYQSNLGAISALLGRQDHVVTDKLDHASIMDGIFLARGMQKENHAASLQAQRHDRSPQGTREDSSDRWHTHYPRRRLQHGGRHQPCCRRYALSPMSSRHGSTSTRHTHWEYWALPDAAPSSTSTESPSLIS